MSEQEKEQTLVQEIDSNEIEAKGDATEDFIVALEDDNGHNKVVKLEDVEEEKEYSDQEIMEMVKLYDETINEFMEGEVIVGKILSIGDKEVSVDIGFKSEGTIPLEEFERPDEIMIGSNIEVFLDNIEDKEGQLILSKKKADFVRTWNEVIKRYEHGEIMQGKCMRRIKGGIVVDLMGIDAFLPGSQIDVKPIRDFDAFIGKTMDFKIVKVNNLRKNIVVSHRALIEEELVEQRQKILNELVIGQVLEGTVKNITDFGVFIDLGGADGLLHINDLSWGRVNHPSEIVALDEKIKVKVLDFNEKKDRISLGLKQLQPHPWEQIDKKYPVGTVVKGRVVNISDYGAFVELEKGVEGLIHISEMSWTQHIKHPSKILAVGETVEAKILSVDQAGKKISLGLKQLEPDPWNLLEVKYPVGSRHQGKVRNLTNFGAFVELEEGIDGLVHISDLSWTKKIRHPGEVVKKGDAIDVVVLNVDRENRRISLGFKQVNQSPWEQFEEKYKVGTLVQGTIVRLIEKGVIAEINEEVDSFIPLSHLDKLNIKKPSDGYKVGDNLDLIVLEFNKEAKKIVCSEKIEYAKSLIQQRQAEGITIEPIIPEDELDEEFSLDKYPEGDTHIKVSQSLGSNEKTKSDKAVEDKKEVTEPVKSDVTPVIEVEVTEVKQAADLLETTSDTTAEQPEVTSVETEAKPPKKKSTKKTKPVKSKTSDESDKKDVEELTAQAADTSQDQEAEKTETKVEQSS